MTLAHVKPGCLLPIPRSYQLGTSVRCRPGRFQTRLAEFLRRCDDRHTAYVRAYVGVTDWDWYTLLSERGATEVNFWQPGGAHAFKAVPAGSAFLFKSKFAYGNQIVGGGVLSGAALLPLSQAWQFFGADNGCRDEGEMRQRIAGLRRRPLMAGEDPVIGCTMLRDVTWFGPDETFKAPPGWPASAVQGKSYDLGTEEGAYLLEVMTALWRAPIAPDLVPGAGQVPGPVFGDQRLTAVRVGQQAFKVLVQEAYGRRCAITGDKIVPVLQAAHIRPVTAAGENRVDNGLLLRSDVHTLFDRGYLAVHPDRQTLLVSQRLRSDWGNGQEFYDRAGQTIALPARAPDRPHRDFLTWHADAVFLAS